MTFSMRSGGFLPTSSFTIHRLIAGRSETAAVEFVKECLDLSALYFASATTFGHHLDSRRSSAVHSSRTATSAVPPLEVLDLHTSRPGFKPVASFFVHQAQIPLPRSRYLRALATHFLSTVSNSVSGSGDLIELSAPGRRSDVARWRVVNSSPGPPKLASRRKADAFGDVFHIES